MSKTPHSYAELAQALGIEWNGDSLFQITESVSVGLCWDRYTIYINGAPRGQYQPSEIVGKIKKLLT